MDESLEQVIGLGTGSAQLDVGVSRDTGVSERPVLQSRSGRSQPPCSHTTTRKLLAAERSSGLSSEPCCGAPCSTQGGPQGHHQGVTGLEQGMNVKLQRTRLQTVNISFAVPGGVQNC